MHAHQAPLVEQFHSIPVSRFKWSIIALIDHAEQITQKGNNNLENWCMSHVKGRVTEEKSPEHKYWEEQKSDL